MLLHGEKKIPVIHEIVQKPQANQGQGLYFK
jgi:hypothetical protein